MKNQSLAEFKLTILTLLLLCTFLSSCKQEGKEESKPNILWIYLEDTSPLLGCYGTSLISTPHIDQLAKDGMLFTNAYMPAPVCSPSRSSIITGVMSTTLGLHNHHSSRTDESAIYLPDSIWTLPEIFRAHGYFTFNNGKDDYNFHYNRKDLYDQEYSFHPMYGKRGAHLPLSNLKSKEPFFGQIQLKGGKEIYSNKFKDNVDHPVDRSKIELPPYLPNHPAIIEEYANHLDAIQITDNRVGQLINELEVNNLLQNTIVFFFSDHGMRMTRHKQFLYDGGLHVPLIITDFRKNKSIDSNSTNTDLVSGLDLGPSALGLAKIPIPTFIEGQDFLDTTKPPRDFVISTRDRCDFTIDRIRSVRSKKYKYIRNFLTDRAYTQNTYMDVNEVEFVRVMKELHEKGKLNSTQNKFLSSVRPAEELYHLENDPYEVNNLATDIKYTDILAQYRSILNKWIDDTNDQGQYPESEPGLHLMLGIWGKYAFNPEYDELRSKHPGLAGSLWEFKNQGWTEVTE